MKMATLINECVILNGADEYWARQGILDGYFLRTDDPIEVALSIPMPCLRVVEFYQECYLNGYYLGVEIFEEVEKELYYSRIVEEGLCLL